MSDVLREAAQALADAVLLRKDDLDAIENTRGLSGSGLHVVSHINDFVPLASALRAALASADTTRHVHTDIADEMVRAADNCVACKEQARVVSEYLQHAPEQGDWPWSDHCDGLAGGIIRALFAAEDLCHGGTEGAHPFTPGIDDMESTAPDPRWCNVCGESRRVRVVTTGDHT